MFDLHVHAAPDVIPRLGTDVQTVAWYAEAGFRGCVLKGHCEPTTGRAFAAAAGTDVAVYGSIVLNRSVGGFNPVAVAAALRLGARVVWMPTVDSARHAAAHLPRPFTGAEAVGSPETFAAPPLDPSSEGAIDEILSLISASDAVLATGHLGGDELAWLIPRAHRHGIRRVLVTHPAYSVPALTVDEARSLAEMGALLEVTAYQLLHQSGFDRDRLAHYVRNVGVEHWVLSSDAGQPNSPTPPEALERLIDELAAAGLDRSELLARAGDVPEALIVP